MYLLMFILILSVIEPSEWIAGFISPNLSSNVRQTNLFQNIESTVKGSFKRYITALVG